METVNDDGHSFASAPSSSSSEVCTTPKCESPVTGSNKRKRQPTKRIILDDDQSNFETTMERPVKEEETETEAREDEREEDEVNEEPQEEGQRSEMLSRLAELMASFPMNAALQTILSNTVTAHDDGSLLENQKMFDPHAGSSGLPYIGIPLHHFPPHTPLTSPFSVVSGNNSRSTSGETTPSLEHKEYDGFGETAPRVSLKRKLFDGSKEAMKLAAASISKEERIDLEDLENFAQQFKKQRIKFGFTQGDVGVALGKRYGTDFSQTTISRFEALNLSFKNMCKLRPLLKEWLSDAEKAIASGVPVTDLIDKAAPKQVCLVTGMDSVGSTLKKRRKRTNLDAAQKRILDTEFHANPRPDHHRMAEIADDLELDRDVVRVWFCNRRQKMRKTEDGGEEPSFAPLNPMDVFPSPILPPSSSPYPPPSLLAPKEEGQSSLLLMDQQQSST